jgi:hypothetical protein
MTDNRQHKPYNIHQTTDNRQQTTDNRQQTTDNRHKDNRQHHNRKQTTDARTTDNRNRQQTTDNRQQTTDNRQQTTCVQLRVSLLLPQVPGFTLKCQLPNFPLRRGAAGQSSAGFVLK